MEIKHGVLTQNTCGTDFGVAIHLFNSFSKKNILFCYSLEQAYLDEIWVHIIWIHNKKCVPD